MRLSGWVGGHRSARELAFVAGMMVAACSGSPTRPNTPPPVVEPPPPPPPNNAPVIMTVAVSRTRAEADEELQVSAVVEDAETPVDQLAYEWTASPVNGAFAQSSGAQFLWRPPQKQKTPDVYTLKVTVTEKYTSGGEAKENKASATTDMHYNDSPGEITKLVMDFLGDFANSSVSPEQCVREFSDSCGGKYAELDDVRRNRRDYQITGSEFYVSTISMNGERTKADIVAPCTFRDISKITGKAGTARGTCNLATIYENWRWYLCDSRFIAAPGTVLLSPYRVP